MDAVTECSKQELGEIVQHHLVSLKFNVKEVAQLKKNFKYSNDLVKKWADEIKHNMNVMLDDSSEDKN